VARKPLMNPATINTILNTAPMILQGATRLIRMIRERKDESTAHDMTVPATIDGLKQEIQQIGARLDANDEANVQEIQLIEELAKQNKALAESLRRAYRLVTLLTWLCGAALICAAAAFIIATQ
jgi:ABC-type hemin transport system substrate-binding protein